MECTAYTRCWEVARNIWVCSRCYSTLTRRVTMGDVRVLAGAEHRCPMLMSFSPRDTPGLSASTIKPVMRCPAPLVLSVTASTKYQSANPPLVIHILEPFSTPVSSQRDHSAGATPLSHTPCPPGVIEDGPWGRVFFSSHSSPCFTAVVWMPATSLPAQASVTPYAHFSGASMQRPRYFFFCSSVPARITCG